jgi:secretion/DNA translocation related TadE-like protein
VTRPWAADDPERGAGTVLLLGVVAVVLMIGVVLSLLVSAQVARAQAQSAADLAALAGAAALRDAVLDGGPETSAPGEPCAVAAEVVRRNGARLASCDDEGAGVLAVETRRPAAWGTASARARAGPLGARPVRGGSRGAGPVRAGGATP